MVDQERIDRLVAELDAIKRELAEITITAKKTNNALNRIKCIPVNPISLFVAVIVFLALNAFGGL